MSQHRRHERGFDMYMDFWHRKDSLQRFIGIERARQTSMIDLDSVEYCWLCYQPLVLIELKRDNEGSRIGLVTARLAKMAGIEGWLVVYAQDGDDIKWFETQRWHPESATATRLTPAEYAEWLWSFRDRHLPVCTHAAARHWMERRAA
jgi:hypothetical protein